MQTEKQREKSHMAARRTAATGLSTAQRKCDWPLEEPQRLWAAAVEDQACPPGRRPCLGPLHQGWVPGVPLGTKPGRPQLQSSTKVSIGPRGAERQAQGGRYGAPGPPWHGGATGKHIAPCQELAYPRISHRPALRSPHLAPSHPGPMVYKSCAPQRLPTCQPSRQPVTPCSFSADPGPQDWLPEGTPRPDAGQEGKRPWHFLRTFSFES